MAMYENTHSTGNSMELREWAQNILTIDRKVRNIFGSPEDDSINVDGNSWKPKP